MARVNENNPTSPDPAAALATASRLTHGRPEVDQVELAAPLAAQVEEVKTKPAEDVVTIAAETSTQVNIVRVADAPVENVMTTDVEAQATRFIPKSNPEIDENVPATADLNRADITIPIAIAAGDLDPQAAEESRPASIAQISPELPHTSEPIAEAPLDQSVAASLAKPTERLTQVRRNAEAAALDSSKRKYQPQTRHHEKAPGQIPFCRGRLSIKGYAYPRCHAVARALSQHQNLDCSTGSWATSPNLSPEIRREMLTLTQLSKTGPRE